MTTGEITKTDTIKTTFHKHVGEKNTCDRFGYGQLKICNQNQGHVSGSMKAYPMNMIQTSQQSTKEGLDIELAEDFISSKAIN